MEHSSTDDNRVDVDLPGPPARYIPTEVCENIIDMLYSVMTTETREHIITLHSCALVCRSWRVRSQRVLFYQVQLSTSTSLHRLSAILDVAQHLCDYVYHVELTGYHLHYTTSVFALFPPVFAWKLPNLYRVDIVHLGDVHETWFPRAPDPPKSRSLPYIPLHPRFPSFLSAFTAVSYLYLQGTTFHSFSQLVRILHGFPILEKFSCKFIRWITPGGAHPGADLMKPPDWESGHGRCILPPFAPRLRELDLWHMDTYGVERLIRTRGPHLTRLELTIPLLDGAENTAHGQRLDLGSCTGLETLALRITPQFSMDRHAGFLTELLTSWKPRHLTPQLEISVGYVYEFTRRGFADVLRGIGTITETWIQAVTELSPDGDFQSDHEVQYQLHVRIYDWDAEKEWWKDHLASCFPSWVRLGRLSWEFKTPTHGSLEWANEEQSPQPDAALTVASRVEEDFPLSSLSESQDRTRSPEIVEHA